MNAKKIFIIAAVLLALIGTTLLVYNLFFSAGQTPTITENPQTNGSLPSSGNASKTPAPGNGTPANQTQTPAAQTDLKIKPISQEQVYSATIGVDGKTVKYYSRLNGHVYESAFDGSNLTKISSVTLSGLVKIIWSPDKEKVIGFFSENNQIKKYFYDYASGQSVLLNNNIGSIAWSPDSKKITYQFTSAGSEQSTISTANPDGSDWKNIFKTRLDNLIVEWPSKEKISLKTQVSGLAQGVLFALDSLTGDFNKVLSDLYGLNIKWSPKADKIIFSSTSNYGKQPKISLSDSSGANTKNLKLSGIIDKCTWSLDDRTIFCALPQEINQNVTWPDDYYKGLLILSDDFYKINLESGEKTKIAGSSADINYDAQDLFLSPKEDYLFFTNRADGRLYSIKL